MSLLRLGLLSLAALVTVEASASGVDDELRDAAKRGDRIAAARLLDGGADVRARTPTTARRRCTGPRARTASIR